jgi:hypothetical protein
MLLRLLGGGTALPGQIIQFLLYLHSIGVLHCLHFLIQTQTLPPSCFRLSKVTAFLIQNTQIEIRLCHTLLAVQSLVQLQSFSVHLLRLVQLPAYICYSAQPTVIRCNAFPAAQGFVERKCFSVHFLGLVQFPACPIHTAQIAVYRCLPSLLPKAT